ncbi:MAG: nitroreductase family deazaflavin-dependent oxidoreductase [Anaerolineales bacterium]|nr:nitroreductase family deazaflavin-dependent oxidoreductase [Anaerolineales bacterium]
MAGGVWYNPLVSWLLRSPLRWAMDSSTLLLTCIGRKSGRAYTFPVSYAQTGDRIRLITAQHKTWWKNLEVNTTVTLWLRGQARTGRAVVTPLDRAGRVAAMLEVYPGLLRRLAEQQAATAVVIAIHLDPPTRPG